MNDVSVRFGVDLKKAPDKPDPKEIAAASEGKVDRAKASIFAWDDDRLQKTAIVTKKIAKAATTLQRFIRACISHWKYYNEYRIPLLEELEDVKRRHREELVEVIEFKKRGFEEARFELDAEFAMPKEQFDQLQKAKNDLKKEIKDEEEVTVQLEKDTHEEKHRTKMLERARHEIDAQHTLSRLDVEIPLLEAEQLELKGVDDEFSDIVKALQQQLDDMNAQIAIEKKHKTRLMKCLAAIVKMLESRGAKAKIITSVKMSIKYKGEDPPPKPPPAPAPVPEEPAPPVAAAEPATSAEETQQTSPQTTDLPTDANAGVDSSKTEDPESEQNTASSKQKANSDLTSSTHSKRKSIRRQKSLDSASAGAKSGSGDELESSFEWGQMMEKDMQKDEDSTTLKRTKSSDKSGNRRGRSKDDSEASFDWGKEARSKATKKSGRKANRRKSRSLSPVTKVSRSKKKGSRDGDHGIGRSKTQEPSKAKPSKMTPRRSVSEDIMSGIAELSAMRKLKNEKASFDWATMANSSDGRFSSNKKSSSARRGKRGGDGDIAKKGHFSFAYGDND